MRRSFRFFLCAAALAAATRVPAAEPPSPTFVGTKRCRTCHLKEHASWSATRMSRAFELLKPGVAGAAKVKSGLDAKKDYTRDAACLPCHTTGYGSPGGFVDPATTPDMAGVGCESCHGAGSLYTAEGKMTLKNKRYRKADLVAAGMVSVVGEAQCTPCHSPKSPIGTMIGTRHITRTFRYDPAIGKGVHERFPLKSPH